jgi:CPA2 family monovalent cation:H+ antiporter-2
MLDSSSLGFVFAAIEIPLLPEIVGILALGTVVILLSRKLNLPTIIGYLLTGIIVGPTGLNFIGSSEDFDALSEIGIILLLFVIGMEFSLKNLAQIKNIVLIGGGLQVALTIGIVTLLTYSIGLPPNKAIFMGFLLSLSSTAIVLKLIQEKGDISSPHGKIALGILIFQDVVIVPLMLFTPLLAGESDNIWSNLGFMTLKGALVIGAVIFSAKKLFPYILYQIAKTKSQELIILSTVGICFAVAYITSMLGLSLGLGAFLAGLIISESEYNHQATSNILPFRELFISFFFVSIGILFDGIFMFQNLPVVLLITFGVLVIKSAVAAFAGRILGYPLRTSLMAGLALFQVGEFSLLLSKTGVSLELLDRETYQFFLAVSILSMLLTPFVLKNLDRITFFLIGFKVIRNLNKPLDHLGRRAREDEQPTEDLKDHLVIIGYGLNGRNLSKAAKSAGIPYVIIEINAETVKNEAAKGEPIHYGDAASPHVLHHVHAEKARIAVIAINDPASTRRIVKVLRTENPSLYIIVRTRFVKEMEEIYALGANAVIPEEFETSVEIFTRVLSKYLVPSSEIRSFVSQIRDANYDMFREFSNRPAFATDLSSNIPDLNIISVKVLKGKNDVVGLPLKDSGIRNRFNINLLAIKRGQETITNLTADTVIECEDLLYVVGRPQDLQRFCERVSLQES